MPRTKVPQGLSSLVESDGEDFSSTLQEASMAVSAIKRPRGRPPSKHRVTKPITKSVAPIVRRTSKRLSGSAEEIKGTRDEEAQSHTLTKRKVRGRHAKNNGDNDDDDGGDDIINFDDRRKTKTSAQQGSASTETPKTRRRTKAPSLTAKATANSRIRRKAVTNDDVSEIPETQEPSSVDEITEYDQEGDTMDGVEFESDERQTIPLRKKLGDLAKKYTNLETRYRDLRDIGVKEAENNFDKLKRQGEERTKAANQLISNLKAEVAFQTNLADEAQRLKIQLESTDLQVASLQQQISELTKTLSETRTENKTLSTRLAASRSAEAHSAKTPGSAVKARHGPSNETIQHAQLKEDLYADLTGLLVRSVKQAEVESVYDCIQTGRNGTLHFKLFIAHDVEGDDYDEAHFTYKPQLDVDRDRALIDVLPDYLVEEITFPRPHAAKFFSRVIRSMMERVE